jgi:hypothetical protein
MKPWMLLMWLLTLLPALSQAEQEKPPQPNIVSEENDQSLRIKSESDSFLGYELGGQLSDEKNLYYDLDKGCFLETRDSEIISCLLHSKKIYGISVFCERNKKSISIDGVECGGAVINRGDYRKFCSKSLPANSYYLRKGNGYFRLDETGLVSEMGLVLADEYLGREGEDAYSVDSCITKPSDTERNKTSEPERKQAKSDNTKSESLDGEKVRTILIIIGVMFGIPFALYLYANSGKECPSCKVTERGSVEEVSSVVLNQFSQMEYRTRVDVHKNKDGEKIGTTERRVQELVTHGTRRILYSCNKCGHLWDEETEF